MAPEGGLVLAHVLVQALALEDVEVGQRHRRGHRVAAEGVAVREESLPWQNGSDSRSETIIAPIGE